MDGTIVDLNFYVVFFYFIRLLKHLKITLMNINKINSSNENNSNDIEIILNSYSLIFLPRVKTSVIVKLLVVV